MTNGSFCLEIITVLDISASTDDIPPAPAGEVRWPGTGQGDGDRGREGSEAGGADGNLPGSDVKMLLFRVP